jgi:predicted Zn-dependent protease
MLFKERKAFQKAQDAMESGQYAEAEVSLTELLKAHPQNYEALLHRSLIRLRLKKPEAALEDAQLCVKEKPENALSYMVEGESFLELKQFESARRSFLKSLALEKDNGRVHFGLGVACAALGLRLEAADAFEQALHFERDYSMAQMMAQMMFK